ncbi:hypothetical protein HDU97_002022 [Phlyctochytrium planicorne]|nr:hypothetical protein HDU97_002022 [Phlyctochytrium planicorne]
MGEKEPETLAIEYNKETEVHADPKSAPFHVTLDLQQAPVGPNGTTTVALDALGPVVVNEVHHFRIPWYSVRTKPNIFSQQDGTLSRISNWAMMSEPERATTLRVLGKRNQKRLEKLKGLNLI